MIRPLSKSDLDATVELWYQASVKAHGFIPADFWHTQRAAMRDIYLPASESWVYEEQGLLAGFISWHQGSVAALFIATRWQSQGLGCQLLDHLKARHERLELTVYAENEPARRFYTRNGFHEGEQRICEHSGHAEIIMYWQRASEVTNTG